MKYRPFAEARDFVCKLGLKNEKEWKEYCKSGNKPDDIPSYPGEKYKRQWKGMGYWLGTICGNNKRQYRPFDYAREVAHTRTKSGKQWVEYCKSAKKPDDIPNAPGMCTRTDGRESGTGS